MTTTYSISHIIGAYMVGMAVAVCVCFAAIYEEPKDIALPVLQLKPLNRGGENDRFTVRVVESPSPCIKHQVQKSPN